MKKILSLFLLSLFICLLAGVAPLRYGLKQTARAMMQERLKGDMQDAGLVRFPDTMLRNAAWETDHEFRINGRLYDVVRVVQQGSQRNFYCLDDALELRLEEQADAYAGYLVGQPGTPQGKLARSLLDWMQGLYFHHPSFAFSSFFRGTGPSFPTGRLDLLLRPYRECTYPPPEAGTSFPLS